MACVHFDAHSDTWDELYGGRVNNATPFRRLIEEELIDPPKLVQIGIRGTAFAEDDLDWALEQGVRIITMDEFDALDRDGVIAEVRRIAGGDPVYVTFDVDGLDPIHCPGTGAPEPGGLSMRDSLVIIRGLQGLDVVGGDVCEVAPPPRPRRPHRPQRRQPHVRDSLHRGGCDRAPAGSVTV
jgi:guanidinopropionase